MGKKTRKTRWRALTIADDQSDSEESFSTSTSIPRISKVTHPKSFYRYNSNYSSQSTPRRKYQKDSTKTTRSSSTASENKITFNEDEYTRITTPRQDVLFKKGYLNKPKTYQTQTSTGTTSTSTGNSTGNGTPDHYSTDLEYESQFVFPNAFIDQNGIYYINSYDSYPVIVYNQPTYFPDMSDINSKRLSTGSLTESVSPHTEEVTSQNLSQSGEVSNNSSDCNGQPPFYNMVYPGYYVNEVYPQDINESAYASETRRIKKKRRRKVSKSQSMQMDSSESTDDSSDETHQSTPKHTAKPLASQDEEKANTHTTNPSENNSTNSELTSDNSISDTPCQQEATENVVTSEEKEILPSQNCVPSPVEDVKYQKYDLKPDAEEFVPRTFRPTQDSPPMMNPGCLQFIKIPPNFVPIVNQIPANQTNGHAFMQPGISMNFVQQPPKIYHNIVGYVANNNQFVAMNNEPQCPNNEASTISNTEAEVKAPEASPEPSPQKNVIDISKIVSKLEKAAKEQDVNEEPSPPVQPPTRFNQENRPNRLSHRFKTRNYLHANKLNNGRYQENGFAEKPLTGNYHEENRPLSRLHDNKTNRLPSDKTVNKTTWKRNGYIPSNNSSPKKQVSAPSSTPTSPYKSPSKNYSQIVKKPPTIVVEPAPKVAVIQSKPEPTTKTNSVQWIPVSSRKKRKNKNVEATDDFEETLPTIDSTEVDEEEELLHIVKQFEQLETKEKESALIKKETIVVVEEKVPEIEIIKKVPEPEVIPVVEKVIEVVEEPQKVIEPIKTKKLKKKAPAKVAKKVMITDVLFSNDDAQPEKNSVKIEEIVESPVAKQEPKKIEEATSESKVEPEVVTAPSEASPSDKKSKKKKKKIVCKSAPSTSWIENESPATVSSSYDFLIEDTLTNDIEDKTNEEVSFELNKLIQKGMYNNLEEKIKSLNIEQKNNDQFFQSILTNLSSSEASVDKTQFNKTSDFSKILNPLQLFKQSSNNILLPQVLDFF